MYLLRIALLQQHGQPVQVPKLAQELSVSPVSANEMCRRLTDKDLITYEPYKGVTLTAQGEILARRVLRHRRLWEVFFVTKLGIEPHQAEEMACRFEHVTPDPLADRLDNFLGHPTCSPQNEPIPKNNGDSLARITQPLSTLTAGAQAQIVSINSNKTTQEFLRRQGMVQGVTVQVLAVAEDGSLLLTVAEQTLTLSSTVAHSIYISIQTNDNSHLN